MRNDAMCCPACYEESSDLFDYFSEVTYCPHRTPRTTIPMQDWSEMAAYVGRRCEMVLSNHEPEVSQVGVMVSLSDDGEAEVIDDDGVRRWCWPILAVRPLE